MTNEIQKPNIRQYEEEVVEEDEASLKKKTSKKKEKGIITSGVKKLKTKIKGVNDGDEEVTKKSSSKSRKKAVKTTSKLEEDPTSLMKEVDDDKEEPIKKKAPKLAKVVTEKNKKVMKEKQNTLENVVIPKKDMDDRRKAILEFFAHDAAVRDTRAIDTKIKELWDGVGLGIGVIGLGDNLDKKLKEAQTLTKTAPTVKVPVKTVKQTKKITETVVSTVGNTPEEWKVQLMEQFMDFSMKTLKEIGKFFEVPFKEIKALVESIVTPFLQQVIAVVGQGIGFITGGVEIVKRSCAVIKAFGKKMKQWVNNDAVKLAGNYTKIILEGINFQLYKTFFNDFFELAKTSVSTGLSIADLCGASLATGGGTTAINYGLHIATTLKFLAEFLWRFVEQHRVRKFFKECKKELKKETWKDEKKFSIFLGRAVYFTPVVAAFLFKSGQLLAGSIGHYMQFISPDGEMMNPKEFARTQEHLNTRLRDADKVLGDCVYNIEAKPYTNEDDDGRKSKEEKKKEDRARKAATIVDYAYKKRNEDVNSDIAENGIPDESMSPLEKDWRKKKNEIKDVERSIRRSIRKSIIKIKKKATKAKKKDKKRKTKTESKLISSIRSSFRKLEERTESAMDNVPTGLDLRRSILRKIKRKKRSKEVKD